MNLTKEHEYPLECNTAFLEIFDESWSDHAHLTGPHYRLADGRAIPAGLAYRFAGMA